MRKVQPIRELKAIRAIKGNLRKKNPRNFLLFTLGINTGLRISDILKLKVEDVKDQAGEIKEYLDLKEKKTKKQRLIYINDEAKNALEYFFDKTGIYNLERYLFISDKTKINKPISRIRAWQLIQSWCREVGIKTRIGTHTLRKTLGYQMRMSGVPIELIQEVLGHQSISMTKRYLGITDDEVTKVLKNFNL
ncbi:Tyrosine recombinase XerD [subsurface metagenome]|jgi:site-specific recombinase XerD|nr:MAG: site-specific integrase [Candidatus Atribacteria bacterium 1244-E10-H5-B2]RXG66920.1 MAG: site-specific integrase [Candidatus Atribacteria bacterium 1244-E10-H5-B2]